jgi:hypothetical protein
VSNIKTRDKLNLTEFFNEINEGFDKKIPTDFKEIDYGDYLAYQFKTNSGNYYDLEFHESFEFCQSIVDGDKTLGDVLAIDCDENVTIDCFDIAFTLTSAVNKDNENEFGKETNKFEQYELMGRIVFIIKKLLQKYNKIKLFVLGNSKRNKIEVYQNIFKNHFSNDFDIYFGNSYHHDADRASFFIIRK